MRRGFGRLLFTLSLLLFGGVTWAEKPENRLADPDNLLAAPLRIQLETALQSWAKNDGLDFYLVVEKSGGTRDIGEVSDALVKEWVRGRTGAVFVYFLEQRQYSFSASPAAEQLGGNEALSELFVQAVTNPPIKNSLDVIVAVPIFRVAEKIIESKNRQAEARLLELVESRDMWRMWAVVLLSIFLLLFFVFIIKARSKLLLTKSGKSRRRGHRRRD